MQLSPVPVLLVLEATAVIVKVSGQESDLFASRQEVKVSFSYAEPRIRHV